MIEYRVELTKFLSTCDYNFNLPNIQQGGARIVPSIFTG